MNVIAFLVLLGAACGAALRYGGAPERWAGGLLVMATILTYAAYSSTVSRFYSVESRVALVDVVLLAGIGAIMLRADRFWPIALFAVHGVTVLSHLIKMLDSSIVRHAYAIAIVAPSYVAVLILIVAVVRHRRRLGRFGDDPDWSVARARPR